MIHEVHTALTIDAPPERVLALLTGFEDYPKWQPETRATEVRERDQQGRPVLVSMTLGAMGLKTETTLAVEYFDGGLSWRAVPGDVFARNDAKYMLRPNNAGGTDVDCETVVGLSWHGLPLPMVKRLMTKNVNDALKAIKAMAEAPNSTAN